MYTNSYTPYDRLTTTTLLAYNYGLTIAPHCNTTAPRNRKKATSTYHYIKGCFFQLQHSARQLSKYALLETAARSAILLALQKGLLMLHVGTLKLGSMSKDLEARYADLEARSKDLGARSPCSEVCRVYLLGKATVCLASRVLQDILHLKAGRKTPCKKRKMRCSGGFSQREFEGDTNPLTQFWENPKGRVYPQ